MHNPLRSEAEMFRVVVIVGFAAAPVIALGLIAGPEWGAIMLAVEVGMGIGLMWRALRGSDPHTAAVTSSDDEVRRILVVANETVTGKALLSEIHGRCAGRPSEVMVIVPALPGSRLEHLAHDVDAALAEARERLDASLRAMARRRDRGARRGRGPSRPQRGDRGRASGLRGRRGDRLDPPAGALEVAGAGGGRARPGGDPAAGLPRGRRPRGRGGDADRGLIRSAGREPAYLPPTLSSKYWTRPWRSFGESLVSKSWGMTLGWKPWAISELGSTICFSM